MSLRAAAVLVATACLPAWCEPRADFDIEQRRWTLSNSRLEARFELNSVGYFRFAGMKDLKSGREWLAPMPGVTSPIRLEVEGTRWDQHTSFQLVSHQWRLIGGDAGRQTIVLTDPQRTGEVTLEFELYDDLAVLRYGVRFRNLRARTIHVNEASPVNWAFADAGEQYRAFRVEQWLPLADPANFQALTSAVPPDETPVTLDTGAHGRYCTWLALADRNLRGVAFGWEFDGRAQVSLSHAAGLGTLTLDSRIPDLHHPVLAGSEFQVPRGFVALFDGNWDEAGYVTQRFVERALAKPVPGGGDDFPYLSWDSWGYGAEIDEKTLRRNADAAARLGVELFVVDLGWAKMLGDWHEDPRKFPSGLRALSDYVHGLGMKFGLHFAFGEAMAASPILQAPGHEDWTSSVNYGYYGAQSLCLAHDPVRRWIADEAVRIIDQYNVDWILQDGENMVRECRKETHTHHADDSNYSGAVDGLGWILREVQERRPQVAWENCENGGNLMTFQMVQNYVTSIVNDASGALGARQSAYGATYPFPSRYADRYMPEQSMDTYTTRSYVLGGPWIFMNRLADLTPEAFRQASAEVENFKRIRPMVRDGKILHVSASPEEGVSDAIAAWDGAAGSGVALVTRQDALENTFLLRVSEALDSREYTITFASDPRTITVTGLQLREQGISVPMPNEWSGELVFIQAQ